MRQGLSALTTDAATQIIVLIAKHPSLTVAGQICEAASRVGKPVVINFLGIDIVRPPSGDVHIAETLEDAAQFAVMLARGDRPSRIRQTACCRAHQARKKGSLSLKRPTEVHPRAFQRRHLLLRGADAAFRNLGQSMVEYADRSRQCSPGYLAQS